MVNTKNKAPLISAITPRITSIQGSADYRPYAFLAHHKPQYIMGKSTPIRFQLTQYVLVHL